MLAPGQTFGRFLIQSAQGRQRWSVLCLGCGRAFIRDSSTVRKNIGGCKSCCQIIHGHTSRTTGLRRNSRAYSSWVHMIRRCATDHRYRDRGISVCQRWANSFPAFLSDMGEPPPKLTLDRIDNDGNYEPANCCWASRAQQVRNRRGTKLNTEAVKTLRHIGTKLPIGASVLAAVYGVDESTVRRVIAGRAWS